MSTKPGGRRRHLSVVPDLPKASAGRAKNGVPQPGAASLSLVGDAVTAPPDGKMTGSPPGITAVDLRRHLAQSGAAQPFLDHAETFGDDVESLFGWLQDYGLVFSERQ